MAQANVEAYQSIVNPRVVEYPSTVNILGVLYHDILLACA